MVVISLKPLLAVASSAAAALLILFFGNRIKENVREAITITASLCQAAIVCSMVSGVLEGRIYVFSLWKIASGVELAFRVDSAGMVFACIASCLWIVTSIYSIGYMRCHHEKNQTGYFAAFASCISASAGIAFASNLVTFFIFYEMLTLSTYPLVTHYRDEKAKASGRRYLVHMLISGQLFFAAIVAVYAIYGTCDFKAGGFIAEGSMGQGFMLVLFLMMVCGGLVKSGVMPLHSWLPAAMVAPTPVSALLHAVAVVKAGVFCVLRIVCFVFGPQSSAWCGGTDILAWAAVATMIVSSFIAMRKDNLKARLAFSTIGQLSYIVMGIAVLAEYSILGAVYHIVAHAFMKITLFMCAGAVYVTTGKSEISSMRGLVRRMPLTCICFAAASLGIAGLPLFAGFISKLNIMKGAFMAGKPFFALVLVASAMLALTYLIPVVRIMFGGMESGERMENDGREGETCAERKTAAVSMVKPETSLMMLVPIVVTVSVSILLGIMPDALLHLYEMASITAEEIITGGGAIAG